MISPAQAKARPSALSVPTLRHSFATHFWRAAPTCTSLEEIVATAGTQQCFETAL
jgi:site-specific recombinase XerD